MLAAVVAWSHLTEASRVRDVLRRTLTGQSKCTLKTTPCRKSQETATCHGEMSVRRAACGDRAGCAADSSGLRGVHAIDWSWPVSGNSDVMHGEKCVARGAQAVAQ